MTLSNNFLAILVSLTLSALAITEISAAPSCVVVGQQLKPCLDFLIGTNPADSPSPECCAGAKVIADQAPTNQDRKEVCDCLREAIIYIGPFDPNQIPQISQKCGVNVYIPPVTNDPEYCARAFHSNFNVTIRI